MDVYFGTNFWDDRKKGIPLSKIPVQGPAAGGLQMWENKKVCIPAVYVGQEGAVLDLCMCTPLSEISAYMERWKGREYSELSDEEIEQAESESPFGRDFDILLSLDGARLKCTLGCGTVWNPLIPETDSEAEALMKEYGLSTEYGWAFHRNCFEWDGAAVLTPEKLDCILTPRKQPVTAAHFVTDTSDGEGRERKVQLIHPLSGDTYTLTIRSCEAGQHEGDWGNMGEGLEYPSHYQAITYTVDPDISAEDLTVQDCAKGDQPRRKGAGDKEADSSVLASSTALVPMYAMDSEERNAYSALRFEPVDRVEWRAVFHVNKTADLRVEADLC